MGYLVLFLFNMLACMLLFVGRTVAAGTYGDGIGNTWLSVRVFFMCF